MVENNENQNALLELILDLKVEALAYQKQADDDHDFALKMMEERDSFERDLSKLERENEELTNQRDQLREQYDELREQYDEWTGGRNLYAELLDAQIDRDTERSRNKELEEELDKVREEICKLRVELEGVD